MNGFKPLSMILASILKNRLNCIISSKEKEGLQLIEYHQLLKKVI